MEEPLWDHVQSFTLNDHIIGTLDHQLFEQDNQTLSPHHPAPLNYLKVQELPEDGALVKDQEVASSLQIDVAISAAAMHLLLPVEWKNYDAERDYVHYSEQKQ